MAPVETQELIARLAALLARTGPFAAALLFLAAFVEYLFPPAPGDLLVLLGAWYATHGDLSWPVTLAAATAGSVAGASVDWRVGVWLGRRLDARAEAGRLDRTRLQRFETAYRRWGGLLLLVNRFLPGIRAFIFLAAGASRIPLREVLLYGGLSALVWNGLLLAVGAFAVRNRHQLLHLFDRYTAASWLLVGVAAAVALLVWAMRRAARRGA